MQSLANSPANLRAHGVELAEEGSVEVYADNIHKLASKTMLTSPLARSIVYGILHTFYNTLYGVLPCALEDSFRSYLDKNMARGFAAELAFYLG